MLVARFKLHTTLLLIMDWNSSGRPRGGIHFSRGRTVTGVGSALSKVCYWSGAAVGSRSRRQGGKTKYGEEEGRNEGRKKEDSRRKEEQRPEEYPTHQQAAAEKQDAFHLSAP